MTTVIHLPLFGGVVHVAGSVENPRASVPSAHEVVVADVDLGDHVETLVNHLNRGDTVVFQIRFHRVDLGLEDPGGGVSLLINEAGDVSIVTTARLLD